MKNLREDYPKVRVTYKKGRKFFEVDCRKKGWTGKPRIAFLSKTDALNKAKEIGDLFRKEGLEGLNNSLISVDIQRLSVLETQLSTYGKTLEDAVGFYLEHLKKTPPTTATIERLTERWVKSVENDKNKNNRQRTIKDLKTFSIQLARDFNGVLITQATRNIICDKVNNLRKKDGSEISQQTRKNYLAKTKQFLNWCVSEELIPTNPIALEKVRVDYKIPKVYTTKEVITILNLVNTNRFKPLIPYICLGLFAGLRPTEAERLNWDNIHFSESIISVEPYQTKVKRSRHADLNSLLIKWLNGFEHKGAIKTNNFQRLLKDFKKNIGFGWIKDGLRQTYATYWIPINQNKDLLANYMGNSRQVIDKHYLKPALKSDAEIFWKLTPEYISKKIIK